MRIGEIINNITGDTTNVLLNGGVEAEKTLRAQVEQAAKGIGSNPTFRTVKCYNTDLNIVRSAYLGNQKVLESRATEARQNVSRLALLLGRSQAAKAAKALRKNFLSVQSGLKVINLAWEKSHALFTTFTDLKSRLSNYELKLEQEECDLGGIHPTLLTKSMENIDPQEEDIARLSQAAQNSYELLSSNVSKFMGESTLVVKNQTDLSYSYEKVDGKYIIERSAVFGIQESEESEPFATIHAEIKATILPNNKVLEETILHNLQPVSRVATLENLEKVSNIFKENAVTKTAAA